MVLELSSFSSEGGGLGRGPIGGCGVWVGAREWRRAFRLSGVMLWVFMRKDGSHEKPIEFNLSIRDWLSLLFDCRWSWSQLPIFVF